MKAGAVLAELKQADFTNALNSARANADLASKTLERFRKLARDGCDFATGTRCH